MSEPTSDRVPTLPANEWPERLPDETLYDYSLRVEEVTGYDSVSTIERMYRARSSEWPYNDTDVFECVFPGCRWRTRDAEKMWHHVHEGAKHR